MPEKSVLFHVDAETRVATLTLNRPDKLNSFTREMHGELHQALTEIEANNARALVITGAGRGFCAGQDLADLDFTPGSMSDLGDLIDAHFNPLVRRIQASPLPIIAAVNGTAAGAGANLAMACDLIVAARSANFIQAFVKIGLVPDSGGTWLLPRRVGEARALGLALTGKKLSAEKAEAWGIVWRAVDDAELRSMTPNFNTRPRNWPRSSLHAPSRRSSRPSAQAPTRRSTSNSTSNATCSANWERRTTTSRASLRSRKSAHLASKACDNRIDLEKSVRPQELAEATAKSMYEADACSRALGIELIEVRPGYARLQIDVRPDFLNGHAICHGGLCSPWRTSPSRATRTTSARSQRAARSSSCGPCEAAIV